MAIEKCRHGQIRGHCDFCRAESSGDRRSWEPPINSKVRKPREQRSTDFNPTHGNRRCPGCNGTKVIIRGSDGAKIRCTTCQGAGEIGDEPICSFCLRKFDSWGEVLDHLNVHENKNPTTDRPSGDKVTPTSIPQYPEKKFEVMGKRPASQPRQRRRNSNNQSSGGSRTRKPSGTKRWRSRFKTIKGRLTAKLPKTVRFWLWKRRLARPTNLLRNRFVLMSVGLAITLVSIAYYQALLEWWPFGFIDIVRWIEPFVQAFGVILVLIGVFIQRHYQRMRWAKRFLAILLLIAAGSYTYHYLDETGKIDSWIERITQRDTAPGIVISQTPSLVQTLNSLDSYLRTEGEAPNSDSGSTLTLTLPEANASRVWVGRAYIAGAKGNPILLTNNPDAKDPSWNQLVTFLKEDPTDKKQYNFSSFVCADFAEMLHNNAESAGWKAAYVVVQLGPSYGYPSGAGHTLNAFQTTDRGLVYIDATGTLSGEGPYHGETTVTLRVGENYIPRSIFPEPGWSVAWGDMGRITAIETIQW